MKNRPLMRNLAILLALAVISVAGAGPVFAEKLLSIAGDTNELGVTTFNPLKVELAHDAMYLIYDRFMVMDADGKVYPGLMESWEISDDGLVWQMHLKKGVKFHDGSPFNAEVAKWFLAEMAKGPSGYMVGAIDKVEIVNDHQITVYMKHADPNMFYNYSQVFMAVPSMEAAKKYGEEFGTKYVVGSGPYKYESWAPGDRLTLVKNAEYNWGSPIAQNPGPAKIDRIEFRDIKEDSTRFLELKTGKLDAVISIPTMFIEKIDQDDKLHLVPFPGDTLFHLVMNTKAAPLDKVLVRKGIALAIDQESITKSVFSNAGKPGYTYLIDSLPARKVDPKFEIRYNPEEAAKALDEAGFKPGPDGIRQDKDGKKLSFKLWAKNESAYRRVAEVVQAQLAKVGVETKITLLDPSTIRTQLRKGEQDLVVRSYAWDNADILEWFFNSTRLGYPNAAMWHDNESDYLMQKAMTRSKTMEERIANFKEYHEYLLSQYVWGSFYQPDQLVAVGSRLVLPEKNPAKNFIDWTVLDYDVK